MSPPPHTHTHAPPPHTHTLFPFPPGCHCYWSGVQRDAGEARVWTATTCASSQCSLHARSPVHGPFTPSPWPPTAARMTPPTLIWVAVGGRGGGAGRGRTRYSGAGGVCMPEQRCCAAVVVFAPALHATLSVSDCRPPPFTSRASLYPIPRASWTSLSLGGDACTSYVPPPPRPPPLPQLSPPPRTHTPQYKFQHA